MLKITLHKVSLHDVRLKRQKLGFYAFKPCTCGCTSTFGYGLNTPFGGIKIEKTYKPRVKMQS